MAAVAIPAGWHALSAEHDLPRCPARIVIDGGNRASPSAFPPARHRFRGRVPRPAPGRHAVRGAGPARAAHGAAACAHHPGRPALGQPVRRALSPLHRRFPALSRPSAAARAAGAARGTDALLRQHVRAPFHAGAAAARQWRHQQRDRRRLRRPRRGRPLPGQTNCHRAHCAVSLPRSRRGVRTAAAPGPAAGGQRGWRLPGIPAGRGRPAGTRSERHRHGPATRQLYLRASRRAASPTWRTAWRPNSGSTWC